MEPLGQVAAQPNTDSANKHEGPLDWVAAKPGRILEPCLGRDTDRNGALVPL